jgi:hypothetical protein
MPKDTKRKQLAVVFLIFMGASILFIKPPQSGAGYNVNPMPGFEGLHSGLEGVEILDGSYYRIDEDPGVKYEWENSDPLNAILKGRYNSWAPWGAVGIEVDNPQLNKDWYTTPKKVDYWLKVSDNEFKHVKGEIVIYKIPLTIFAHRVGGTNQYTFHGEKLWFTLTSVVWDKAVQEQSPFSPSTTGYGQAWEAPLLATIQSYNVQDAGTHGELIPSEQGRDFTLYSGPEQSGTISDLNFRDVDLNSTFNTELSPDSRLSRTAFFSINLSDFGVSSGLWWSHAPVADYVLKVYTIRVGKYTYTNPDDTPWGEREPEPTGWEIFIENLQSTLGDLSRNPLVWIIAAIIGLVVLSATGALTNILLALSIAQSSRSNTNQIALYGKGVT